MYFKIIFLLPGCGTECFLDSLSNVMLADFPNYFYKRSLAVTVPSYCAVALMGNFCQCRFSYNSCEMEIFPYREGWVIIF